MRRELRAEWTKLRTTPGPLWLLLATVVLSVAVSAGVSAVMTCPWDRCVYDPARVGLSGVQLAQGCVALLGVLAVCGEYSSGMMRTTLTAMPRRSTVLAAKAILVTGLALAAGGLAVLGSLVAGQALLTPDVAPGAAAMARAAVGSVLYLALIALLSVGVAVAVRDSAVAVGTMLGLLYLPPVVMMIADPDVQRMFFRILPSTAGLAVQATTTLSSWPIGPWAGLGVAAAWAAAALLGGGLLLRRRDA